MKKWCPLYREVSAKNVRYKEVLLQLEPGIKLGVTELQKTGSRVLWVRYPHGLDTPWPAVHINIVVYGYPEQGK